MMPVHRKYIFGRVQKWWPQPLTSIEFDAPHTIKCKFHEITSRTDIGAKFFYSDEAIYHFPSMITMQPPPANDIVDMGSDKLCYYLCHLKYRRGEAGDLRFYDRYHQSLWLTPKVNTKFIPDHCYIMIVVVKGNNAGILDTIYNTTANSIC